MAVSKLFEDKDGGQLKTFVNSNGLLCINVGDLGDAYYSGYICLNKEDASILIDELKRLVKSM